MGLPAYSRDARTTTTSYKSICPLRFDDELTFHPAVTQSATIAAVERVGSCGARNKLHHRGSSLFELEAVFRRTKNESGFTFGIRSVGVQIDLEAMSLIEGREPQLHRSAQLHADRRRRILIFFGGDCDDLNALIRLEVIWWSAGP
jgi:hypothetical protein